MRFLKIGLISLLLGGCASSPIPPSEADQVPFESIYGFTKKTSPDDARIIFTRDTGISCGLYDLHFMIDGERAASVGTGEAATFYHRPGPVMLGITSNAMCGGGGLQELSLDLKPGYSYQVRGSRGIMGDPAISLSGRPPYLYKK